MLTINKKLITNDELQQLDKRFASILQSDSTVKNTRLQSLLSDIESMFDVANDTVANELFIKVHVELGETT